MSTKKSSLKKPIATVPFKDLESKAKIMYYPTIIDLDLCEQHMEMKDIKNPTSDIFKKMPKSVFVHGKSVPRTALRKRDLCHLYLLLGGKIVRKAPKPLKHFTPSKKKSKEQKQYENLIESQTKKDHKVSIKKNVSHEAAAVSSKVSEKKTTKLPLKHQSSFSKKHTFKKTMMRAEEEDPSSLLNRFKSMKIRDSDTPSSSSSSTSSLKAKKSLPSSR